MADRDDDTKPPHPSTRGRNRELWVGLFVLVGLIGGLSVLFTMTDPAMLRGRYFIQTMVQDAGGIRKGDPVRMLGVIVGRVTRFRIDKGRVEVQLEIEGDYPIPKDSKCVIKSKSFLGEMVADILPGTASERVPYGGTIEGALEVTLMDSGNELKEKANDIMGRTQSILSDATIKNVESSTTELNALLAELGKTAVEQRRELLALSKSMRKSAEGLEKTATSPELQAAVKRMDALTAQMEEATGSFTRSSKSLEAMTARLDKGEGSLGLLMKDEALYKNMNETMQNANKLLVDFREHPKKYVKLSFF
jgi:phospholipid/cholesterol/gamma-HCH transport system substrate-binding protein